MSVPCFCLLYASRSGAEAIVIDVFIHRATSILNKEKFLYLLYAVPFFSWFPWLYQKALKQRYDILCDI
jgi:hypothetical protein